MYQGPHHSSYSAGHVQSLRQNRYSLLIEDLKDVLKPDILNLINLLREEMYGILFRVEDTIVKPPRFKMTVTQSN